MRLLGRLLLGVLLACSCFCRSSRGSPLAWASCCTQGNFPQLVIGQWLATVIAFVLIVIVSFVHCDDAMVFVISLLLLLLLMVLLALDGRGGRGPHHQGDSRRGPAVRAPGQSRRRSAHPAVVEGIGRECRGRRGLCGCSHGDREIAGLGFVVVIGLMHSNCSSRGCGNGHEEVLFDFLSVGDKRNAALQQRPTKR